MVDSQAFVAVPGAPLIVPKGIGAKLGMEGTKGVGISEMENFSESGPGFRQAEGIAPPTLRVVDVAVGRANVEVAAENKHFFVA